MGEGCPENSLWENPAVGSGASIKAKPGIHEIPVVTTTLLHGWKISTWESGSKYPDTSQPHMSIAPTLMSLKKVKPVWNRVCIGLNFQPRNFYPISFLLNDLEHVLLGEEVFILSIYLNHLC